MGPELLVMRDHSSTVGRTVRQIKTDTPQRVRRPAGATRRGRSSPEPTRERTMAAKAIFRTCEVRTECFRFAPYQADRNMRGTDEQERTRLRRRRGRPRLDGSRPALALVRRSDHSSARSQSTLVGGRWQSRPIVPLDVGEDAVSGSLGLRERSGLGYRRGGSVTEGHRGELTPEVPVSLLPLTSPN
jgi:hypothetical protein